MWKQLKTDMKLHGSGILMPLCLTLGSFVLGLGLCALIMFTDAEPGTWFPMGTVVAMVCVGCSAVVLSFALAQEFTLALSMGRTRKEFLGACALRTALWQGLCWALVLGLYRLEIALGSRWYSEWPLEVEFAFLYDVRFLAAVLPAGTLVTLFLGSLYGYFGKKALAPLWFVWMAACLGLPRLVESKPELLMALMQVPAAVWVLLALAVAAAMAATVIILGRKQMVR